MAKQVIPRRICILTAMLLSTQISCAWQLSAYLCTYVLIIVFTVNGKTIDTKKALSVRCVMNSANISINNHLL